MAACCSSETPGEPFKGQAGEGSSDTIITGGGQKEKEESMDADLWSKMPEELLEKIIARLPLRFLFQSRSLSKFWASKMDCGSFQNEVSAAASKSWRSYCPLYVGNEGLIGYDIVSKQCEKILTLSYLPYPRAALITNRRGKISGAGALMCFVDCDYFPNIYVTNVITRKFKILPSRPNMTYPAIVHLLQVGSEAYKVILITPMETPCSQIYDSVTNTWSMTYAEVAPVPSNLRQTAGRWVSSNRAWISSNNAWTNSAFFNGTLYVLWGYQYDGPCELLAYNLEEGSWINIRINILRPPLKQFEFISFISMSRVLVCADVMIIVIRLDIKSTNTDDIRLAGTAKENLVVFEVDSETRQIKEVSRGPPLPLIGTDLNEAAADGENVYFYQKLVPNSSIVVYSVRQKAWTCLPSCFNEPSFQDALKKRYRPDSEFFFQPTTFSFQPGQNPFVQV